MHPHALCCCAVHFLCVFFVSHKSARRLLPCRRSIRPGPDRQPRSQSKKQQRPTQHSAITPHTVRAQVSASGGGSGTEGTDGGATGASSPLGSQPRHSAVPIDAGIAAPMAAAFRRRRRKSILPTAAHSRHRHTPPLCSLRCAADALAAAVRCPRVRRPQARRHHQSALLRRATHPTCSSSLSLLVAMAAERSGARSRGGP